MSRGFRKMCLGEEVGGTVSDCVAEDCEPLDYDLRRARCTEMRWNGWHERSETEAMCVGW
jgi:hypothetical protein